MSVVVYVLGLVVAVLLGAVGELVSDEIRARLDRIPLGILTMASKRLPPEQRKTIYAEAWLPKLRYILQGDEATPITRLIHGIRFAGSLWLSAPKLGGSWQQAEPSQAVPIRRGRAFFLTGGTSSTRARTRWGL